MNQSNSRDSVGQSADLRTRIKHLLDTHRCDDCTDDPPDWTGHLADVLIIELGLPPTWGTPSFDNGSHDA